MTTSTHDASPQRTATRAPVGKPIRLQFDGTSEIIEGTCRNISIGGMFIEVDAVRSQGSLVRFELLLDDDKSIRGLAEVVWARSKAFGPSDEVGIGIKFRFLEQQDRQLIFKLVSQYIKERLASRPPMTMDPVPPATEGIYHPPDSAAAEAQNAPDPPTVEVPIVGAAQDRRPRPDSESSEMPPTAATPAGPPAPSPWPGGAPLDAHESMAPEHSEAMGAPSSPPGQGSGPSYLDDAPIDLNAREQEPAWRPDPELTGPIDAPPMDDLRGSEVVPPRRVSRRPKSRSSLMPLLLLGIVLALLVFGLRDKLFGPPPPMDEPLPAQVEPTPTAPAADGTGTARRSSGSEGDGVTPGLPQEQVGTEVPVESAAGSSSSAAAVPSSAAAVPSSSGAAVPSSSGANSPARGEFTQITDIRWRSLGEGMEITVTADGEIPAARVKNFRLNGDSPREVIQLLRVRTGFSGGTLAVNGPGVRQIRTGLNEQRGVSELRIVLDLTGSSARLQELQPRGNTLVMRVEVD